MSSNEIVIMENVNKNGNKEKYFQNPNDDILRKFIFYRMSMDNIDIRLI